MFYWLTVSDRVSSGSLLSYQYLATIRWLYSCRDDTPPSPREQSYKSWSCRARIVTHYCIQVPPSQFITTNLELKADTFNPTPRICLSLEVEISCLALLCFNWFKVSDFDIKISMMNDGAPVFLIKAGLCYQIRKVRGKSGYNWAVTDVIRPRDSPVVPPV